MHDFVCLLMLLAACMGKKTNVEAWHPAYLIRLLVFNSSLLKVVNRKKTFHEISVDFN